MYQEWRSYDSSLTREKLFLSFNARLRNDKIPFTVVALKDGIVIGTISLKQQDEREFTALSGDSPWLGSLHVVLGERNKGLGEGLVKIMKTIARELGHKSIFMYTSNPSNIAWYHKRGAHFLKTCCFRNHTVTIMEIPLTRL